MLTGMMLKLAWGGIFNGPTLKPIKLCGNRRLIHSLGRAATREHSGDSSNVCIIECNQLTGQKSIRGGPELKQSQAYTFEFGQKVLEAFTAMGCGDPIPDTDNDMDRPYSYPPDAWALADLPTVLRAASRNAGK